MSSIFTSLINSTDRYRLFDWHSNVKKENLTGYSYTQVYSAAESGYKCDNMTSYNLHIILINYCVTNNTKIWHHKNCA